MNDAIQVYEGSGVEPRLIDDGLVVSADSFVVSERYPEQRHHVLKSLFSTDSESANGIFRKFSRKSMKSEPFAVLRATYDELTTTFLTFDVSDPRVAYVCTAFRMIAFERTIEGFITVRFCYDEVLKDE
jgi:hypothetical protein